MKESVAARLRPRWYNEMKSDEATALTALKPTIAPNSTVFKKPDMSAIVAWADENLFERRAVIAEHELLSAALARGRGEDFDLAALRQAIDERSYVREKGTDKLTSREALGWEAEVVIAAHDGRNTSWALNPDYRPSPDLSAEQAAAVEKILKSRNLITLFRGAAGTGKSFALREVEHGLSAAKHPVVVLAPQRQQVQALQADGLPARYAPAFSRDKPTATRCGRHCGRSRSNRSQAAGSTDPYRPRQPWPLDSFGRYPTARRGACLGCAAGYRKTFWAKTNHNQQN
jgi:hypothetical protein